MPSCDDGSGQSTSTSATGPVVDTLRNTLTADLFSYSFFLFIYFENCSEEEGRLLVDWWTRSTKSIFSILEENGRVRSAPLAMVLALVSIYFLT